MSDRDHHVSTRYGIRSRRFGGADIGEQVEVMWGRWAGRRGVLLGASWRMAGGAGERSYPLVDLVPCGRAEARTVAVVSVRCVGEGLSGD